MLNYVSRNVSRRYFGRVFKLRVPVADTASDDVWGFLSKEKSDDLVQSQKTLAFVIQKSYVGTLKEQLQSRGFEQDDFHEGCKIAYQKVADIYRKGEPIFQTNYSDLVEEPLAVELDEQLTRYKKDAKAPRLTTENVDARLLFLIRARKESFEGPFLVRLINSLISMSVQNLQPRYELLAAVEYKVNEKFELVASAPTVSDANSEKSESKETNENHKKVEPSVPEKNSTTSTSEDVHDEQPSTGKSGTRKHFLVLAADLPVGVELPEGKEADTVEFRIRSMGRPFGFNQ
jgi:hypothetical protein